MADAELAVRLDSLTRAFSDLARKLGARLTRTEMCDRYGVSSKTLTAMMLRGDAPRPGRDGKWLLAEVIEWETARTFV